MKIYIKLNFLLIIMAISLLSSCREESIEVIDESIEPGLKAETTVANLMIQTSLKDGSIDNIIDNASCFSIKLPVTVIVNSTTITLTTESDYEIIESVFDENNTDTDILTINYPIIIIFSDYTEMIINSKSELESYIDDDCNNGTDDDIECVDFEYPIVISVYNTSTEELDNVNISNDKEMHDFMGKLDDSLVVNIKFPVQLLLSDGTELTINTLKELENAIDNAKDDCDEDDDNDFDDDDNTNIAEQEFRDLISSCSWKIDELEIDDDELENYKNAIITFNVDNTVTVEFNGNSFSGSWSVTTNSGLRLNITIESLSELNKNWRFHKFENEDDGKDKIDLRVGEDKLELKKNCT